MSSGNMLFTTSVFFIAVGKNICYNAGMLKVAGMIYHIQYGIFYFKGGDINENNIFSKSNIAYARHNHICL